MDVTSATVGIALVRNRKQPLGIPTGMIAVPVILVPISVINVAFK